MKLCKTHLALRQPIQRDVGLREGDRGPRNLGCQHFPEVRRECDREAAAPAVQLEEVAVRVRVLTRPRTAADDSARRRAEALSAETEEKDLFDGRGHQARQTVS